MSPFRLAAVVLLAGPLFSQAPAQQPIRTGTQAVEIDARVVDAGGRFVGTLTAADFVVVEDGAPQEILSVYVVSGGKVTSPVTRGGGTSSDASYEAVRQAWLFVFDTVHLSPGTFTRTRDAVLAFVRERFQEGQLGGVVSEGRIVNNRLTTSRTELEQAIAGLKAPSGSTRSRELDLREWPAFRDEAEVALVANGDRATIADLVRRACEEDPSQCQRDVSPDDVVREKGLRINNQIRAETGSSLSTIRALSASLARVPGPKTVVYVSEGMVAEQLLTDLEQAVGQAARSGARFYALDARGLNRGSGAGIIDQPAAQSSTAPGSTFDLRGDATASLSVATGGFAIRNENNVARALGLIAADSESYYVIGYRPSNQSFDGKYRKVDVSVRPTGLKVRARRGYVALDPARLLTPVPITTSPAPSAPAPAVAPDPATPAPEPIPTLPPRIRTNAEDMILKLAGAAPGMTSSAAAADEGWAAYQRGDLARAAVSLKEAAAHPAAPAWISYALGFALVSQNARADAADAWEKVRAAAPEFEPVYHDLADLYVQLQNEAKAVAVLRLAEKRFPSSPDIYNAMGVIHSRRGALDESVRSFTKAVEVAPEDSLGYFNLGRSYQMRYMKSVRYIPQMRRWTGREDDRERAIENFEKYVKMGGPYVEQAREALAALSWTVRKDRAWRQ